MPTSRATPRPAADAFSEGGIALPWTEVFSTGEKRGKTYTPQNLDEMVRNFERFGKGQRPGFDVPAVVGHEETPEEQLAFLQHSGTPASGWVQELRRNGDKLEARFRDIHPDLADCLDNHTYGAVSAEIYNNPQAAGLDGDGMVLRRVAMLGGQLPEDKSLKRPPDTVRHSEPGRRHVTVTLRDVIPHANGQYTCFSEATPMPMPPVTDPNAATPSRDDMIRKLSEKGADASVLSAAPDETLAEFCRMADDWGADDPSMYDEEPEEIADPDKKKAAFGQSQKMKAYAEKCAAKYGEASPPDKKDDKPMPDKFNETAIVDRITSAVMTRIDAKLGVVTKKVDDVTKFAEQETKSRTRATIDNEVKAHLARGAATPAQLEAGLFKYLYKLPTDDVTKFSEGGKEKSGSSLDEALAALRAAPVVVRFGERFKQPTDAPGSDTELAKIERFCEEPGFVHALHAAGKKPTDYVADFKKAREKKPELTAAQYGVPTVA